MLVPAVMLLLLFCQEGAVRLLKLPEGTVKFSSSAKNQEMKEMSEANATMKSKVGRNNRTFRHPPPSSGYSNHPVMKSKLGRNNRTCTPLMPLRTIVILFINLFLN